MSNRLLTRDIEQALQWAFCDELPKGIERGGLSAEISPMFRLADLGTRVDDWSVEPGFPRAMGECDPDAVEIEAAVLALEHAKIDWPATRRSVVGPLGGLLTDNEPTLKYLTIGTPGLVALHAKMRTRPQWDFWPQPEPIVLNNGKPKVQFEDENGRIVDGRKGRHYGPMARCPLRWWPEPREAAFVRIEYSIWWQALDTLADYLRGKLARFDVAPPAAHPSPWIVFNGVKNV